VTTPENVTEEQKAKAAKLRKITAIALVVAAGLLLVWDIYVANNDVKGDTISELVRDLSHDYWSLPFILMGIMGHLFWNRQAETKVIHRKPLFITTGLVIARDLLNLVVPLPTFAYANLLMAALGFIGGVLWWPQLVPKDKQGSPPEI